MVKYVPRILLLKEKEYIFHAGTKLKDNKRAYHLLDAVGTKPNVVYQVKVRNTKKNV